MTIHDTPKRSITMPKLDAEKAFANGISTLPPSARLRSGLRRIDKVGSAWGLRYACQKAPPCRRREKGFRGQSTGQGIDLGSVIGAGSMTGAARSRASTPRHQGVTRST